MESAYEEVQRIREYPGEIVGNALRNKFAFIEKQAGRSGVADVERLLREWGSPLTYHEIKNFQWYPIYLDVFILLAARDALGWGDTRLREMGKFAAKISIVTRIMVRHFTSLKEVARRAESYWRRFRTVGNFGVEKFDEENRHIVVTIDDFPGHAVLYRYLEGYFWQVVSYIVPREKLQVTEMPPVEGEDVAKIRRFRVTW